MNIRIWRRSTAYFSTGSSTFMGYSPEKQAVQYWLEGIFTQASIPSIER